MQFDSSHRFFEPLEQRRLLSAVILAATSAPAITSADQTTFIDGTSNSFTVTATGNPVPTLVEKGLPPGGGSKGVTLFFKDNGNGTATISGDPLGTGVSVLTLKAKNGITPNAKQTFTLTFDAAPAIISRDSAAFVVGTAGKFVVNTTGFPTPAIKEVGSLPAGVTFIDRGNGKAKLSGAPAGGTAGSYTITIKAGNGVGSKAKQTFNLTVTTSGTGFPLPPVNPQAIAAGPGMDADAILLSAMENDTLVGG